MNVEVLMNEAKQLQEELKEIRRKLHRHAETGFDLTWTKNYVKNKLTEYGYTPEECGKCGLFATVGKAGKVFLLRADMDALPIQEEAAVDFACLNGNMHACGHDMHTAMLLGAAKLLKKHEAELKGTVKLMFQAAEEIFEGSRDMIEAGVLDDPPVDVAMMIHVVSNISMETGNVIVCAPGVSAPAADLFEIRVQGKGCHGSMPEVGIDPLLVSAHILLALEEIKGRELSSNERATLTFGTMHAGTASNIIPDSVLMGGSLRTYDEKTREKIKGRIKEISTSIAAAYRAEAEVIFSSGCPVLLNDAALSKRIYHYVSELLGTERVTLLDQNTASGSSGSEDFAYISQQVPAIMLSMAAGKPEEGYIYPQHHPKVSFDENALCIGCAVHTYAAVKWLDKASE